jgi:DNA damage-inducible protein 1
MGVGSAPILGRIHSAPFQAGGHHFAASITVLDQDIKFIFGLDNLRRHACCVDLGVPNALRFGSTGAALPFLPDYQCPKEDFAAAEGTPGTAEPADSGGPMGTAPVPLAAPAPPAAVPGVPAGWEDKIGRLVALGFSRDQALGALRATNGNEDVAASMLFG